MRNLYVAVGLALCSTSVLAADFGLGVSAKSDDGVVYLPIDISKSFRIEPNARYAHDDSSYEEYGREQERDLEVLELGIGVFGLKQVTEAARFYFGARLAYVESKEFSYGGTAHNTVRSNTELDGYRIGPTVGFEYSFGQHFSVGGEASYSFLDLEGKSASRFNSSGFVTNQLEDIEQKSQGTQTRLIFRYMF